LKSALLEGLATGKNIHLDLERAGEVDLAISQLLWAAGQEVQSSQAKFAMSLSESAQIAFQEIGFEHFPVICN